MTPNSRQLPTFPQLHNLEATPWHPFPLEKKQEIPSYSTFKCSYLACPLKRISNPFGSYSTSGNGDTTSTTAAACPAFFQSIHKDLEPWKKSGVTKDAVEEAGRRAAMRIVISAGRMFVDFYYACVQSRMMFTVWSLLQLMKRYPGMVPDVDLMFDCMDRPVVLRANYSDGRDGEGSPLPPLFRYCTTKEHFDIPYPDWSFWGWPEVNIKPWDEEFQSIKVGSQAVDWNKKFDTAYWKGNPDVFSPVRTELVKCNDTEKWGAQIMRQDWSQEVASGFQKSKLSDQCNHRYKIYAEGYAWSVSLKYILACGSLTFIIQPEYEDFFTRGLIPRWNYWPIGLTDLCQSLKKMVDWGNRHPSQAKTIGKRGQLFMQETNMDRVYDYMYNLILEYSKLQKFKPVPSSTAQEVCEESLLCIADDMQREFLEKSYASPASSLPCILSADST